MINKLIRFSKSCGETINDRAMSLEEKGRNLNILGAEYYREMTRLHNMLNDSRALEVLNLQTPTYKPKGGLRKTGKKRKTRKNQKTRRRR